MSDDTTYKLKNDEEDVIHDERPLPPVAISRDTKDNGADRPEHQHERDAPGYVGRGLPKLLGERLYGQRHGEEVERVPRLNGVSGERHKRVWLGTTHPRREGAQEKGPLLPVEHAEQRDRVLDLGHGRLERRDARPHILPDGHVGVLVAVVVLHCDGASACNAGQGRIRA